MWHTRAGRAAGSFEAEQEPGRDFDEQNSFRSPTFQLRDVLVSVARRFLGFAVSLPFSRFCSFSPVFWVLQFLPFSGFCSFPETILSFLPFNFGPGEAGAVGGWVSAAGERCHEKAP